MNNDLQSAVPKPVITIHKGVVSDRGISDLRKAGYIVIVSTAANHIRQFPEPDIQLQVLRAKAAALDYLLHRDSAILTADRMRRILLTKLAEFKIVSE